MRRIHGAPLLVALLVGVGLLPAVVRADTPPPPTPAPVAPPSSLVVGLSLGNARLQAGVVRGRDVILARGFEVELLRTLARRLGGRVDGFVFVPAAPRLLATSLAPWHLAVGGIEPVRGTAAGEPTAPYLTTDIAVVTRRRLETPRRLADLRGVLLCAVRGSVAARVAVATVRPARATMLVAGPARLLAVLRTGACDAALVPALEVGRFVDGNRRLLGPVVGRVAHGKGYSILVRRGTGLDVSTVDRQLDRLARDGTVARLARSWLGLDPSALPVLR